MLPAALSVRRAARRLPVHQGFHCPYIPRSWLDRLDDEETAGRVRRGVDDGGIFEGTNAIVVPGRSEVRVGGEWNGVVLPLPPYILAVRANGAAARAAAAALRAARDAALGDETGDDDSGSEDPSTPRSHKR